MNIRKRLEIRAIVNLIISIIERLVNIFVKVMPKVKPEVDVPPNSPTPIRPRPLKRVIDNIIPFPWRNKK